MDKEKFKNLYIKITKKIYKQLIPLLPLKKGIAPNNRGAEVIISLTSYPKRFDYLYLCLKSLLYQTVKPNKIILWLGDDSRPEDLPSEVLNLKNYGVDIEFVNENIRSHKKYYYAMEKYPDSIIITVDDDSIYSPFIVESLLKCHKKYPDSVCARRTRIIPFESTKMMNYSSWYNVDSGSYQKGMHVFAVGVGGVLYPPHCLNSEVFNKEKFKDICMNADDIWLKFMEVLNGTEVAVTKCLWSHPITINKNDNTGLQFSNRCENRNDVYFKNMINEYPVFIEILDSANECKI